MILDTFVYILDTNTKSKICSYILDPRNYNKLIFLDAYVRSVRVNTLWAFLTKYKNMSKIFVRSIAKFYTHTHTLSHTHTHTLTLTHTHSQQAASNQQPLTSS